MDETWQIRRTATDLDRLGETESVFALGNGWVLAGPSTRASPTACRAATSTASTSGGKQSYPEDGYAFPQDSDTVISAPNAALIRLWVAGEPLDLRTGTVRAHERTLDPRAAWWNGTPSGSPPAGHGVRVRSTRLVSLPRHAVAAVRYQVEPLDDRPVEIRVCADVLANERVPERADDPRAASVVHRSARRRAAPPGRPPGGAGAPHRPQRPAGRRRGDPRDQKAPAGFTEERRPHPGPAADDRRRVGSAPGGQLQLTKYAAYECAPVDGGTPDELADLVTTEVDAARQHGFDALLADQRAVLDERVGRTADVEIDGDAELQQAVRFSVFHLLQAGRVDGDRTIAAKGLTGNGYDGHVLWDTESYVLPVLTYLLPGVARGALRWRHAHLPEARDRAAELRLTGATFPWRTIGGRECSGYWPAGHRRPARQRRHRRRGAALRHGHRRPGVPRRHRAGAAGGDGPALGRLRPLVRRRPRSTSPGSPVPTSTPPWSTTTSSPT